MTCYTDAEGGVRSVSQGLPIPEGDSHICRVWFAEDGKEYSAKLHGCVEVRTPDCVSGETCGALSWTLAHATLLQTRAV